MLLSNKQSENRSENFTERKMNENGAKNYRTLLIPLRKSVEETNTHTHRMGYKNNTTIFSEHKLCHAKCELRLFRYTHKKRWNWECLGRSPCARFNCFIYGCHLAKDRNQCEPTFWGYCSVSALFNVWNVLTMRVSIAKKSSFIQCDFRYASAIYRNQTNHITLWATGFTQFQCNVLQCTFRAVDL